MLTDLDLLTKKYDIWINHGFARVDLATQEIGILIDELHGLFAQQGIDATFEVYDAIAEESNPAGIFYKHRTRHIVPGQNLDCGNIGLIPGIMIDERLAYGRTIDVQVGLSPQEYACIRFRRAVLKEIASGAEYKPPEYWSFAHAAVDLTRPYDLKEVKVPQAFKRLIRRKGWKEQLDDYIFTDRGFAVYVINSYEGNDGENGGVKRFLFETEELEEQDPVQLLNRHIQEATEAVRGLGDIVARVRRHNQIKTRSND